MNKGDKKQDGSTNRGSSGDDEGDSEDNSNDSVTHVISSEKLRAQNTVAKKGSLQRKGTAFAIHRAPSTDISDEEDDEGRPDHDSCSGPPLAGGRADVAERIATSKQTSDNWSRESAEKNKSENMCSSKAVLGCSSPSLSTTSENNSKNKSGRKIAATGGETTTSKAGCSKITKSKSTTKPSGTATSSTAGEKAGFPSPPSSKIRFQQTPRFVDAEVDSSEASHQGGRGRENFHPAAAAKAQSPPSKREVQHICPEQKLQKSTKSARFLEEDKNDDLPGTTSGDEENKDEIP
ncbi:unnamed protein product, partial [Amoebophrya sp. A120]|eukprot:GSA120T00000447001.1